MSACHAATCRLCIRFVKACVLLCLLLAYTEYRLLKFVVDEKATASALSFNEYTNSSDSVGCHVQQTVYSKAKQECVMGVGMRLYAQLVQVVQTKNIKRCKSAIMPTLQCCRPH